jgi:hypothetical protein
MSTLRRVEQRGTGSEHSGTDLQTVLCSVNPPQRDYLGEVANPHTSRELAFDDGPLPSLPALLPPVNRVCLIKE